MAFPVLQIGHRIVSIGLLCLLAAAVLSACGDDPLPTDSPPAVSAIDTPNAAPVTPTSVSVTGPVPASNIPFPTPTTAPATTPRSTSVAEPTPTPDSAVGIMASARLKMADAGSFAFETSFSLEGLLDGRTHDVLVTYVGDFHAIGYSSADVSVAAPDETVEARVVTFDHTTHVLNASTQRWEVTPEESPYFIDLTALFGRRASDLLGLRLTGQEMVYGVDTHRVEGRLQELEIAGARGDFEVVYLIGTDDGLLREVFAFGHLKLDDDTTLIGNLDAETASIKLTARLLDHGKQVDLVTPTLAFPRFTHESVLLDDGRVLVGGGFTGIANNNFIAPFPLGFVQLYDPEAGMWLIVEPLQGPGLLYSAIKLADGRVLFAGLGGDDESMASLFDPASESWTSLPGLSSQRGLPNLVLLADGRVLVAGGLDFSGSTSSYSPEIVNAVEILDPATGGWQRAASMNQVSEDQWLFSLNDGRVLAMAAVGDGPSDLTAHAEMYDPAADTWTVISSLDPHYVPTDAIKLSDGRLLVLLGALSTYSGMSSQIYDPITDTWTQAGEMAHARVKSTLTLLPDGRVLAAGGEDPAGSEYVLYSTTEIFDPVASTWSYGPDLSGPRSDHSATLLPDGRVFLVGGIGVEPQKAERYPLTSGEVVVVPPMITPTAEPAPMGTPTASMSTSKPSNLLGSGMFATLLALIPNIPQAREIMYINDYARVREMFDIALPGAAADDVTLIDYILEVTLGPETSSSDRNPTGVGPSPWISGFAPLPLAARQLENSEHLAFDVRNVDQSVLAGSPPGLLEVVKGRFDPEATDRSLERCSECPPPDRITHQGVEFYSWGEDLVLDIEKRLTPPAFDAIGRGGRIAVFDSHVYRTVETQGMRFLISTRLGRKTSLADDPDLALAAREMDSLEVYSGLLMDHVESFSLEAICSSISAAECDRIEGAGVLGEYDVLGTGVGRDEEGLFVAVTLVYGREHDAADDKEVLEDILETGNQHGRRRAMEPLLPQSARADGARQTAQIPVQPDRQRTPPPC